MKNKITIKTNLLFISIVFPLIISCGNEGQSGKTDTHSGSGSIIEIKACEFFTLNEMNSITGINFSEVMQVLHEYNSDGTLLYTQCSYYTEDMTKTVSVFFRESSIDKNPATLESYMETSKVGDPEIDAEIDKALSTAVSVMDVGERAYWYSIMEVSSFVAFWNNRQVNISLIGFDHNDKNLGIARQIMESIISKL